MLVFIVKYMFKVTENVDVISCQCERLSTVLKRLNSYLCGTMKKNEWSECLMRVENKL